MVTVLLIMDEDSCHSTHDGLRLRSVPAGGSGFKPSLIFLTKQNQKNKKSKTTTTTTTTKANKLECLPYVFQEKHRSKLFNI